MSLKITKAGMLDTVQDLGRPGHQHLGINTGGAMDRFSASLANALLGKETASPAIELHFPAAEILFQNPCVICLAGADFSPCINGVSVPLHQPLFIDAGAVLSFAKKSQGERCYLALLNELRIGKWLNSVSTNLKAAVGGYEGRRLLKNDAIEYSELLLPHFSTGGFHPLLWRYNKTIDVSNPDAHFIPGCEWDWLTAKSQTDFLNDAYTILPASDRMGYRLSGDALEQRTTESLLSSPVSFGTIQLLPNGQLVVLMADGQTTGGYPRIGHVVSAHLPRLAQKGAGGQVKFVMASIGKAEEKWVAQQRLLNQLQNACKLKMQNWLHAH